MRKNQLLGGIKAAKRYLFKDTAYLLLYLWRYFQNNHRTHALFYTDEEFIKLISSGKSFIRIGDGEMGLLHFCKVRYQVYSDAIRNDFLSIIKNYTTESNYIILIPPPVNYSNRQLKAINRFYLYRQFKITFELIFNKQAKYFDQLAFYKNGQFEKLILPYAKTRQVIIVTNQENAEKIRNSPSAADIHHYVICENENTYESRVTIKNDIISLIEKTGRPKSDFVILMSAGLSKTIIPEMADQGYQVLDIGKGLESYYLGISIEHLM